MKKIYFTRHGQSQWNVENKICGATDIPLTELGHQQAIIIGEKIKQLEIHIDEIRFSPLMRAADTAKHISEMTGIPAISEMRLFEQNFGKYEGTPRDGNEFQLAKKSFLNHFDGGESMMQMAQRIYNLLDELKKDNKVYLLVAHNGIARVVNSYFYDMNNDEYAAFGIKNCELLEYEFK